MAGSRREWEGGYVRRDARGRDVYVIRRMVRGCRYDVSTRCNSARAALEQLARFEADPEAYDPRGARVDDPIFLDEQLARGFLEWSRTVRNNTRKWVGEQRSALAWWAERLAGQNLRRVSLPQIVIPALDGTLDAPKKTKGRAHKIATLKALYGWLRKHRHLLTSAEDPTVDFAVPQATPAQRTKHKEYTPEQIAAVVRELDPDRRRARLAAERNVELDQVRHMTDYRDHVQLAAATGWHVTELHRFATAGRVLEPTALQSQDGTEAVLETIHKNGEVFRTRVGPTGAAAARRIRATAGFSVERYAEAVCEAARVAGVAGFRGALRHSALTWATELEGEEAAQKLARHKSGRTTKKYYAERAAPPNPLGRLRLV